MKTLALPVLCVAVLGAAACSLFVQADRSKVNDDLYTPTDAAALDAGADGGELADGSTSDAGDADGG